MEKIFKVTSFLARKFLDLPLIKNWLHAHPGVYTQLTKRMTPGQFTGLPLTLLVVAFLYVIFLLLGLTQDYLAGDPITFLDARVANLIYFFRNDTLLRFFYFMTLFAESSVIVALSLFCSVILWINRQPLYAFTLWFCLVAGEGLTFLGKHILHRERPDVFLRAITEDSFSFPSGHATSVVIFYGFLAYIIVRNFISWRIRVLVALLSSALVALVDFSRLYLGVHYFSDVLAGNLVGLAALLLSIGITEWFITNKKVFIPNTIKAHEIVSVCIGALIFVSTIYHFASPPSAKAKPQHFQMISVEEVISLFDNNLPKFTETLVGAPQEPINLIIIASSTCFVKNIATAGWVLADNVSIHNAKQLAKSAFLNQAYPTAPLTPSFFNAEPNDFGFEKQTERNSARARHHARFWKTIYETPLGSLYVGTVSLDTGIKWGITHTIAPDIDTERDLFVSDLNGAMVLSEYRLIPFVSPHIGKNFSGDLFFTEGKSYFLVFAPCQ